MINPRILDLVMLIELGLLVFSVVLFFAHGAWLYIISQRNSAQLVHARSALVKIVAGTSQSTADIKILKRLPTRVKTTAFLEMSRNISGDAKDRLRAAARSTGLVEAARGYCRSRKWKNRLRGARLLTNLDERDDVVRRLLRDSHPDVRAQAAEWAAIQPTPAIIDEMLMLLGDSDTEFRFAVQDALLRMGREVVSPLGEYLDKSDGTAAELGLELAAAIAEPRFLAAGLLHSRNEDSSVRASAARLLASIGSDESKNRLMEALHDPIPEVRAAAASGLGKMRHWAAAVQMSRMLADPTWSVRRESAMALRKIGGPGMLLLQRAAASDNESVADIAQLILDTPLAE
ncbi:MAG: HEAT repeat domain-containing protein [Gemmatimonadaceae bacterium]|nr:HEAT repeat domain-containing protein [Gemmatimonadaceae bacterium]